MTFMPKRIVRMSGCRSILLLVALLMGSAPIAPWAEAQVQPPSRDQTLRILENRRMQQVNAASSFQAFHNFHFEDRREQSGITFEHQVVEDAGK